MPYRRVFVIIRAFPGGDLASTCMVKSLLRAEVPMHLVKLSGKIVTANDNFALAA